MVLFGPISPNFVKSSISQKIWLSHFHHLWYPNFHATNQKKTNELNLVSPETYKTAPPTFTLFAHKSQEPEFSQKYNFHGMIDKHSIFYFKPFPEKNNDNIFRYSKIQNPIFWAFLDRFSQLSLGNTDFSRQMSQSLFFIYGTLASCKKSEK